MRAITTRININYIKLKIVIVKTIVMLMLLNTHVYAATNGDWTGTTDQNFSISFSVFGNTVNNVMTRMRVNCSGFNTVVIKNLGSAVITGDSFTINDSTNACTPFPPFSYKPYSFTCNFSDENTCKGTYQYNSTQTGTWEASTSPCDKPVISVFSATPDTINSGESSTLNWSIIDATTANINQGIGSVDSTNGGKSVLPSSTSTYTLTATNSCGTVSATTTVLVDQSNQDYIAEYLFNGNADDTSGNGLNGTVFGATLTNDRFGRSNRAYFFDGIDDFIHLPSSNIFYSSGGFTWTVWMKPNNNGGAIISAGDTEGCEDFQLGMGEHPPNAPVFKENAAWATVDNVGGCSARNILDYVVPGGIYTKKFHHLSLRVDFSNHSADLFLDGLRVDTVNISGVNNSRNMIMTIGAFRDQVDNPWMLFDGVLDDIHFYDKLLSDEEILNMSRNTGENISSFHWSLFLPSIVGRAKDCNGVMGGGAYMDNCGICVGGTTQRTPCAQDCNGEWGGQAVLDECGVCNGSGVPCPTCIPIPTTSIVIDSDFNDWSGIPVAMNDLTGDGSFNNSGHYIDVQNLYISKDKNYLFFRFEFKDNFQNNLDLDLNVAIGGYSLMGHFVSDAQYNWTGISKRGSEADNRLFKYPSSYIARSGNNVEYKIPISDIPIDLHGQIIDAWIYITGENKDDGFARNKTCSN